jgi:DNA-binding MarR family transcriptional regulator
MLKNTNERTMYVTVTPNGRVIWESLANYRGDSMMIAADQSTTLDEIYWSTGNMEGCNRGYINRKNYTDAFVKRAKRKGWKTITVTAKVAF